MICRLRSFCFTLLKDEGHGRIIVKDPFLDIKIIKKRGARITLNGDLIIKSHLMGTSPVRIILKEGSLLIVDGQFIIGNGVKISLERGARLEIGGKNKESASGITSDSLVMVNKRIRIGSDFIGAWNLFISDSDWHSINNRPHQKDVIVGNHVWAANNTNILKGSLVGDGCIIAGFTKLINKTYGSNLLIAGSDGKVIREDISWSRDISGE